MIAPNAVDLLCPNCGLSDSVRRVPVVSISSLPADIVLARLLAPPDRPGYRSPWGFWSGTILGLLILGLVIVLVATERNVSTLWTAGVPVDPLVVYLLPATLFFLIPIVLVVVWKERQRTVRQRALSEDYESWKTAMDLWEHLYYCGRCDGVFAGGQLNLIPTGEVEDFLRRTVGKDRLPIST